MSKGRRFHIALFALLFPLVGWSQSVESVIFSSPGGFYDQSFPLELFNYYSQNQIRYTTNGNLPTAQSRLYTGPLLLDESLYSTSDIYTINLTPDSVLFVPDAIRHCIVIRAAVFDMNGNRLSEVATNSYFIHALGCDTHGLPAVSLCADSLDLFDYDRGILVPGAHFNPSYPFSTGNYYQTGTDWERPANIEYYDANTSAINQLAGLRVQGKKSRRFQQKALKIYARETYGKKRFEHRFFETIPNDSFKHLTLKPFCASFNQTGINDYLANSIASSLDVETLASRPVVLFLNGEYWGIYFLHEKPDERYLEDHLGVDPEQLTILDGWGASVDCGNPQNYIDLFQWMSEADLHDTDAYAFVASKIDIDNFIDYYIFELFFENTDWPNNNMRCWQLGDGKWRWIFFDGDACMCWMTFKAFDNAVYVGDNTWPSSTKASLFFRKLLVNEDFRRQLDARFRELTNTLFNYANTSPLFEEIKNALAPEIPFQVDRFGCPPDLDTWNTNLERTRSFLQKRSDKILPVWEEFLLRSSLEDPQLTISVSPNPTQGDLRLLIDAENYCYEQIVLYDLLGRKVYSQSAMIAKGSNELSLSLNLTGGVYLLKVGCQAVKIVKQ